ncbi:alpha-ketoglutarate dependent xanthine dioxygenase [Massarina eburnea CBS 473.64]|uniref:Alpha-ketoglutarate dependent xanthine dioxygenase n=1 Tax=Massarina eburnea CBS 473.64 TaxID=1395130 RepID=A0A6A6RJK0_9PLEO|nr:alpha-ketoglutarate dependent xanthine dioxygenase [Massarina eburnea CBS 473.64]
MPHAAEPLTVRRLPEAQGKSSHLGAEARLPTGMQHIDLFALSEDDKQALREGLFENGVVVIRNQQGLDPNVMPQIGKFFDSTAWDIHSGGVKMVTDAKNILSVNRGARIPRAQQVSVIGKGRFRDHEGIEELDLKHVSHTEFHETPLSAEEISQGFTRPYRWHMDAPLYERLPGFVTTLHAIQVPKQPDQKIKFSNGEIVDIPAGATAFYSGARAYELLSDDEKEFAQNTKVRYAPRAYEWMLDCKATDDALTIAKVGKEKRLDALPEWSWDKVHMFPMVWKNAQTGNPHLQVLGACVYELHTTDPATGQVTIMNDLQKVRDTVHKLLKRVYAPENIYFHRWQEGDLVIFHNRGVLHSITGELSASSKDDDSEKRLLWQCTMASGTAPVPYRHE